MLLQNDICTLDKIKSGQNFLIKNFIDPNIKFLSTRLGMTEGETLKCIYKIPNGPVILQKKFQEIALGQNLLKNIQVQLV